MSVTTLPASTDHRHPATPNDLAASHTRALLGAQLVFNVGFFAVVPFLAGVLREDFLLTGAAVGLVLGLRTAAQQGLFLFGGVLADRFGARTLILLGCAVRVSGFSLLAWSTADAGQPGSSRLGLFIAGTVLAGMGGALFSPALEASVARGCHPRASRAHDAVRPPRGVRRSWCSSRSARRCRHVGLGLSRCRRLGRGPLRPRRSRPRRTSPARARHRPVAAHQRGREARGLRGASGPALRGAGRARLGELAGL